MCSNGSNSVEGCNPGNRSYKKIMGVTEVMRVSSRGVLRVTEVRNGSNQGTYVLIEVKE